MTDFYQPVAARRRNGALIIFICGLNAYLELPGVLASGPSLKPGSLFKLLGLLIWIAGCVWGLRQFRAPAKPVLSITREEIKGRKLFGRSVEIPVRQLREILGGGDNLRVRLEDGRVESLSMVMLSKEDRTATVEAARDLVRGDPPTGS